MSAGDLGAYRIEGRDTIRTERGPIAVLIDHADRVVLVSGWADPVAVARIIGRIAGEGVRIQPETPRMSRLE